MENVKKLSLNLRFQHKPVHSLSAGFWTLFWNKHVEDDWPVCGTKISIGSLVNVGDKLAGQQQKIIELKNKI